MHLEAGAGLSSCLKSDRLPSVLLKGNIGAKISGWRYVIIRGVAPRINGVCLSRRTAIFSDRHFMFIKSLNFGLGTKTRLLLRGCYKGASYGRAGRLFPLIASGKNCLKSRHGEVAERSNAAVSEKETACFSRSHDASGIQALSHLLKIAAPVVSLKIRPFRKFGWQFRWQIRKRGSKDRRI